MQCGNHVARFGPDDDIDPQVDLDGRVETNACALDRMTPGPPRQCPASMAMSAIGERNSTGNVIEVE
jgi:hypothetical protein